jgi:hypothetical protein
MSLSSIKRAGAKLSSSSSAAADGAAAPTVKAIKRTYESERETEQAAIWGSDVVAGTRIPRSRAGAKQNKARHASHMRTLKAEAEIAEGKIDSSDDDGAMDGATLDATERAAKKATKRASDDEVSDAESDMSFVSDKGDGAKKAKDAKKKKKSKESGVQPYKIHCFVAPGTTKNDVRELFDNYEDPSVELKVSQKGNALNKTHYALVTFKNKPMALHAVLTLEGSNQRDTVGVNPLRLSVMLSRDQRKRVTAKQRRAAAKADKN